MQLYYLKNLTNKFNDFFSLFVKKKKTSEEIIYLDENQKIKYLTTVLPRLEELLNFKVQQHKFFIKALTHRSYLESIDISHSQNERLEYLGDAVLNLAIGEYLYKNYPNADEGFLTKTRALLANRDLLGDAGERIHLIELMFVSKSVFFSKKGIKNICSNAFEALIGAIYLDKGYEKAYDFIVKYLISPFLNAANQQDFEDKNYKGKLLEFAQKNKLKSPFYKVVDESGPPHNKSFTIEVYINDELIGVGQGPNKKSAEQQAAKEALNKMNILQELIKKIKTHSSSINSDPNNRA